MHASATRRNTNVAALLRTAALALLAVFGGRRPGCWPGRRPTATSPGRSDRLQRASGRTGRTTATPLNPGGTVEDGLVVVNHGKEPLDLAVYAADGFTTDDGQLDLLDQGREVRSASAPGSTPTAGSVTIQPGKSVEVPFTVTLPKNATPGDYMGGIITSLTAGRRRRRASTSIGASAIRVRLRVGGELKPSLAVEDLHVDVRRPAQPVRQGRRHRHLHDPQHRQRDPRRPSQTVSVSGPFGWLRGRGGRRSRSPPELLPGEQWEVSVPVHGVRPAVTAGRAPSPSRPLLTDASGSITPLEPVEATTHGWAIPWTLLLLVVVLIAVVAGAVLLARRSRDGARRVRTPACRRPSSRRSATRSRRRADRSVPYVPCCPDGPAASRSVLILKSLMTAGGTHNGMFRGFAVGAESGGIGTAQVRQRDRTGEPVMLGP